MSIQSKGSVTDHMLPLSKGLHLRDALADVSNLFVLDEDINTCTLYIYFGYNVEGLNRSKENLEVLLREPLPVLMKL